MPVVVTPRKNLLGAYVFDLWTNNGNESQLLEQDLVVALEDAARKLLIFRNEAGSISVFHQGGQQWIDFRKCYMYLEVHEEEEEQHSIPIDQRWLQHQLKTFPMLPRRRSGILETYRRRSGILETYQKHKCRVQLQLL
jgi:hypothetical protein